MLLDHTWFGWATESWFLLQIPSTVRAVGKLLPILVDGAAAMGTADLPQSKGEEGIEQGAQPTKNKQQVAVQKLDHSPYGQQKQTKRQYKGVRTAHYVSFFLMWSAQQGK